MGARVMVTARDAKGNLRTYATSVVKKASPGGIETFVMRIKEFPNREDLYELESFIVFDASTRMKEEDYERYIQEEREYAEEFKKVHGEDWTTVRDTTQRKDA